VCAARERQRVRFGTGGPSSNARMGSRDLARFAPLSASCLRLLEGASRRLGLSARGFDRVRRVARTLADFEGSDAIGERHVAEAVQYRAWTHAPVM
jgi:magnesium chelatase family protein